MFYQIINIILMTSTGTMQGIALENMLEGSERTTRKFRLIYWTFLAFSISLINVLVSGGETTILLRNVMNICLLLIVLFFFYKGPLWKRFTALMMVTFALLLGEMVFVIGMMLDFVNKEALMQGINDKTNAFSVLAVSVSVTFSAIAIIIVAMVWNKVSHKGSSMKNYLFFMLYILNQVIVVCLMEWTLLEGKFSVILGWSMMTNLICEIVLVIIIFGQSEKETIENTLFKERQKRELEQIHYESVERHRTELMNLTKDNKNMIEKVCTWLEADETKEAEEFLMDWSEKIAMTKEYPYCSIPIVNVILAEKKKECDDAGIALSIDVQIPEIITVEQMDLCCIMGNLLDNAIRAGKQVVEADDQYMDAKIEIAAGCVGEYLIIKCKNTTIKVPGAKPEGTGLGHKILFDIAKRYQGDFCTKWKNGEFEAQISVKY